MTKLKCATCGKETLKIKFIGEAVYCRPCAKKIPPVAIIRHLGTVDCECGVQAPGVQIEFGEFESDCICFDCLRTRLEEMVDPEGEEDQEQEET
jgi:hypothetical protein